MPEVLEYLRNIGQGEIEVAEEYRKRLKKAVLRCGNVQSKDEKINLYIDGLSGTTGKMVRRYQESVHRREMIFESLAHFKKAKYEAYRARGIHITQGKVLLCATCTIHRSLRRPNIQTASKKVESEFNNTVAVEEEALYSDQTPLSI